MLWVGITELPRLVIPPQEYIKSHENYYGILSVTVCAQIFMTVKTVLTVLKQTVNY